MVARAQEIPAMTDLMWLGILVGLTLATLAFLRLCESA